MPRFKRYAALIDSGKFSYGIPGKELWGREGDTAARCRDVKIQSNMSIHSQPFVLDLL
jgi:hypothetical protein